MDISSIRKRYDLPTIEAERDRLQDLLANAHNSDQQIDMSATSAELAYHSDLHTKVSSLIQMLDSYDQAQEILTDKDMAELAQEEITTLTSEIPQLDEEITQIQIEKKFSDPDDMKSVILEIRAGAGGEEASLFASDLYRMYTSFASNKDWQVSIIDSSTSENGGYKEISAQIQGKNAYKYLKYESGVHRVQRIPVTESSGRIHTSTASVAILPEARDVDVQLDNADIKVETMRASGAGGQHVNKTSSAIRLTHIPTGITVSCQESRLQQQNKARAMELMRAKLYEQKRAEEAAKRSDMRSSQIGTASRSEKVRTYNYPQSRITDHRIKHSWHDLEGILSGDIQEVLDTLNSEMLKLMLQNS